MQGDYLSSLILAIYALRNQLTNEWPEYPSNEIKQIVEQSGLFLGDNAIRTLTGLIENSISKRKQFLPIMYWRCCKGAGHHLIEYYRCAIGREYYRAFITLPCRAGMDC